MLGCVCVVVLLMKCVSLMLCLVRLLVLWVDSVMLIWLYMLNYFGWWFIFCVLIVMCVMKLNVLLKLVKCRWC